MMIRVDHGIVPWIIGLSCKRNPRLSWSQRVRWLILAGFGPIDRRMFDVGRSALCGIVSTVSGRTGKGSTHLLVDISGTDRVVTT